MEKKELFKPEIEIIKFNTDIITTSGGGKGIWDDND